MAKSINKNNNWTNNFSDTLQSQQRLKNCEAEEIMMNRRRIQLLREESKCSSCRKANLQLDSIFLFCRLETNPRIDLFLFPLQLVPCHHHLDAE